MRINKSFKPFSNLKVMDFSQKVSSSYLKRAKARIKTSPAGALTSLKYASAYKKNFNILKSTSKIQISLNRINKKI